MKPPVRLIKEGAPHRRAQRKMTIIGLDNHDVISRSNCREDTRMLIKALARSPPYLFLLTASTSFAGRAASARVPNHAAGMGIQEVSKSVIYHTNTCKYCGINWCSNYERSTSDVERHYQAASISLQSRGCNGVTSAWPHVRNSHTSAGGDLFGNLDASIIESM